MAEEVGRRLAEAGAVVVCGGHGGVMEAACRGATAAGGLTVGILPGSDRAAANRFLTFAIPTGMGELRNGLVVRAADGLKIGRPVIGLGTWELARAGAPDSGIMLADSPQQAVGAALARDQGSSQP